MLLIPPLPSPSHHTPTPRTIPVTHRTNYSLAPRPAKHTVQSPAAARPHVQPPTPTAPITVWLHALQKPHCPIPRRSPTPRTTPDSHRTDYSLAPRPAWFTKNSVYFLCKLCYTVFSVRRTGQFRAKEKEKYANVYAGRDAIYQTIQGQRGWGWPLGIGAHFLRNPPVLKGVYKQIG